jgi:hypothetical protein
MIINEHKLMVRKGTIISLRTDAGTTSIVRVELLFGTNKAFTCGDENSHGKYCGYAGLTGIRLDKDTLEVKTRGYGELSRFEANPDTTYYIDEVIEDKENYLLNVSKVGEGSVKIKEVINSLTGFYLFEGTEEKEIKELVFFSAIPLTKLIIVTRTLVTLVVS